ncbi:MAG: hypothetical protein QXW47_01100 [Candidatus Jordarchaeales archaeon]
MEVKLVSRSKNPFFNREEVEFVVEHEGEGTPNRVEVRRKLAALLNVSLDQVFIRKIETEYGVGQSKGVARVYSSKDVALQIEPDYLINRNLGDESKGAA